MWRFVECGFILYPLDLKRSNGGDVSGVKTHCGNRIFNGSKGKTNKTLGN